MRIEESWSLAVVELVAWLPLFSCALALVAIVVELTLRRIIETHSHRGICELGKLCHANRKI